MKRILLSILALTIPFLTFAQETAEKGLDETINEVFADYTGWFVNAIFYQIPITEGVGIPWVVIMLLGFATFFTFYFKFINIGGFATAINVVRGKYDEIDDHGKPEDTNVNVVDGDIVDTIKDESQEGEVSHFQALTAALSGTVGLGNIAGVAIAITIGGPGATFWMIVAGLLGMTSKFAECTLGVKYRDVGEDGTVYGGPMYYLKKGLSEKGAAGLGKVLAVLFAIFCIGGSFGGGNMFQSNQAAQIFNEIAGFDGSSSGLIFGIVMAIFVGIVIIGGLKRIASVTEKVVPFMVGIYLLAAFVVIGMNFSEIGSAFAAIFNGAFAPEGVVGGFVGVLIQGFRRAAFSNEAGVGSAAIAHSAVKTNYAASEGIVALLEPFIDTVVVCTITALVIVITGNYLDPGAASGVQLTSNAFASAIPWFPYVLTIAVVLFAFSTMISWSYYGLQSWLFLFGKTKRNIMTYKIVFCLFTVLGASISLGAVTDFSDAMIFAMAVPNLIGVSLLLPRVREELKKYRDAIKASKN
ncbi:alanine:cation symporter family protein [Aquimarina sp. MMG015]|uniref:alanine/glycine:cation symporter family protein n=1 Tax=Aquimarina sp. MMG015 TaxID=2822689 RepID=UPI001B3A2F0D|nr:alanine/glycine:cation symporter family protein [Aquimarina sp. MMG015]MBQ4805120.1 alanine:cation symporter family protein [Aquimarina sp. MMG015]